MNNNELKFGTFNLNCSSLIEASAGTGKTYTITYLVLRLLLGSKGFDENNPEVKSDYGYHAGPLALKNILVVTFTKAAASDLKARIREKIVKARIAFEKIAKKGIDILDSLELEPQMNSLILEMVKTNGFKARDCALILLNAERSIDDAPICTIHSFCTSALHKIYTFEAGEAFDVELCEDISEQSLEAKNRVWRELFYTGDSDSRLLAAVLAIDSDEKLFDKVKNCQKKLELVRNTDSSEGYYGYNLMNMKHQSKGDIRKSIEKILKTVRDYLDDFHVFSERICNVFKAYEVITRDDEPGALFQKIKGAAPKFKNDSRAAYRLLRDICRSADKTEREIVFLNGEFTYDKDFTSISRQTDRNAYPGVFVNAEKIIELESLYVEIALLHQKILSLKDEILFNIAIMAEQRLDDILDRDHLIGFDGIIRRLDYVLNYKEGSKDILPGLIRASYPVAMIDEFQDTDPVQFSIFSKLYLNESAKKTGACCYLIGDPKQSIYGFRKADIHSYLKARALIESLYGKDSVYTLSTNYRSQEQIVEGVNGIFTLREDPFFFEKNSSDTIEFGRVNSKIKSLGNSGKCSFRFSNIDNPADAFAKESNYVEFITHDDVNRYSLEVYQKEIRDFSKIKTISFEIISQKLARAIQTCLSYGLLDSVSSDKISSRAVKPSDIAVLVRNGTEAKLVQSALKSLNIASVYYSDNSRVFDEESSDNSIAEYDLIMYLIEAMDDYANRGKVKRLLYSQLCSASEQESLESQSDNIELEVALLKQCRQIWEKTGFYPAFSKWVNDERHQCLKENLRFTGGERMVTNLWHLAELLQSARAHEQGIQAQKRWYMELRSNPSADTDSDMLHKRLESEVSQVAIYTIFKSKGLEFPLVFMPYLWSDIRMANKDNAYFYDEKQGKLYFDVSGSDSTLEQKNLSDLQEDARLLYVALTRACAANFMYISQLDESKPNALISEFIDKDSEKSAFLNARELFEGGMAQVLTKNASESESLEVSIKRNPFRIIDESFYEEIRKSNKVLSDENNSIEVDGPSEFDENFKGILQDFRISSYSGIVSRNEDGGAIHAVVDTEIPKLDFNRFNFPRNAIAGTYLHSLMENCDFSDSLSDESRRECIRKADLTNEAGILKRWYAIRMSKDKDELSEQKRVVLSDWISNLVQAKLPCADSESFRLCDLKKGDWLCELEFLFPSKNFDSEKLVSLRKRNAEDFASEKGLTLDDMNFSLAESTLSGFVKGFIDLTVRTGEGDDSKFYVLDYKSNFMGAEFAAYNEKAVARNMLEHCYDVQYLFYSLAMHRFLKNRIENYSYDRHFGGIIYLYMRGMKSGSSNAVIYTKPKLEIIEALSSIFGE